MLCRNVVCIYADVYVEWEGGGWRQLRPLPLQSELFDANRRNWNRAELSSLEKKSKSQREQKNKGCERKGGRGGINREELELEEQQPSISLSSSLSLSLGPCLASYWGGTSSLCALQLRLSVKLSTPSPFQHRQSLTKKKRRVRRGGGSHRKTKVAPIEANAPDTPQFFTQYTHIDTQLLFTSLFHCSH